MNDATATAGRRHTGRLGIYVHVPFCVRRCPYCDFAVTVVARPPAATYADALLAEWAERAPSAPDRQVQTLYLGGGTPAMLGAEQIGRVVDAVASQGHAPREVTVEVNPELLTRHELDRLVDVGVTRISLGAQSLRAATLATLGRAHTAEHVWSALDAARAAGLAHLSVDLIVGAPNADPAEAAEDAALLAAHPAVDHLSVYELTWEPRTALTRRRERGRLVPVDEDALSEALDAVEVRLRGAGFERYEVSNYARPGGRSRHNQLYWAGDEYLGLGVGAHSLHLTDNGAAIRSSNTASIWRYLSGERGVESELLTAQEHLRELVLLALRLSDPSDLRGAAQRLGATLAPLEPAIRAWAERGLVDWHDGWLTVVPQGRKIADSLALELF